jgi:type I site-specific restriction-modification system R (restriction) subunit
MTMASHKRKGVDVSVDNVSFGPAFVVVDDNEENVDSLKHELQQLREDQANADSILSSIQNVDENDGVAEDVLMEEASRIKSKLDEKLREAKHAYQAESSVLKDLKNQIDAMHEKRSSLFEGTQELEQKQVVLQKRIALHQEEASQEIDSIDKVEEERKRQVPRLKTQISLYASTTGIKWNFAQDDILSGSVVRSVIKEEIKGTGLARSHSFSFRPFRINRACSCSQ